MERHPGTKKVETGQVNMFVLDASVVIKWFTQEELTAKSLELRNNFVEGKIEIAVPDLLIYELANALRYNPHFQRDDVEKAIDSLYNMGIDIIVPLPGVMKSAIEMGFRYNITVYDAAYPALAQELGFTFVTADKAYSSLLLYRFLSDATRPARKMQAGMKTVSS